jgi:HD-like signal output (HDOD) protein
MLNSLEKQKLFGELRQRLEAGVNLPVLPDVARELLMARSVDAVDVNALVGVIEKDPVTAGQVLSYARMSSFGYGERIKSLGDAVQLVLGYEQAMHLAIGLSAARSLPVAVNGPLGLRAYWSRALRCASLVKALANELPSEIRPDMGICYLAGLVHDIGFLLFGVIYPEHFAMLNSAVANYKDVDLRELEFHCIGITHDMIGGYLMQEWQMPDEIIIATREHHFRDYDGRHSCYAHLVFLADRMIRVIDNPQCLDAPWAMAEKIGLDKSAIQRALSGLKEIMPDFDQMAETLVA